MAKWVEIFWLDSKNAWPELDFFDPKQKQVDPWLDPCFLQVNLTRPATGPEPKPFFLTGWVRSGWLAKKPGWVTGQPVFALGQKNWVQVRYFLGRVGSGRVKKFWPILPCLFCIHVTSIQIIIHNHFHTPRLCLDGNIWIWIWNLLF